jgi:hypothetical protein
VDPECQSLLPHVPPLIENRFATMSYEFDVFISYPRRDPVGPWVQDRLHPLLTRWLGASMIQPPRIFIDGAMEDGTNWPSNLSESLHRSKYMVAVLAPPYFGSAWCLSEWDTMRRRATSLGLGTGLQVGLIQPIRFIDGNSFPQEAQDLQDAHSDYRDFNQLPLGAKPPKSKMHRDFEAEWRADWPRLERPPMPQPPSRLAFEKVGL